MAEAGQKSVLGHSNMGADAFRLSEDPPSVQPEDLPMTLMERKGATYNQEANKERQGSSLFKTSVDSHSKTHRQDRFYILHLSEVSPSALKEPPPQLLAL